MDRMKPISVIQNASKKKAIDKDMLLYHHLQNPSKLQAQIINEARDRLLELLNQTISKALISPSPHTSILTLEKYSPDTLGSYLLATSKRTTSEWAAYLANRRAGGSRELFSTREYAEYWLECAAPVKFVDGAWLARLHHGGTLLDIRPITRIAWQIFSEELGDGDLNKNHVHLYAELLNSFGSKLPAGDTLDFVDPKINTNDDEHVWAAAVVQLALGLFPDEFLPEALGFNLAYERVAFETLVAAHELKELKLDPLYFNLHVTIDNADSGHTAMALEAVKKFLNTDEAEDQQRRWKRVQAGFLLATHMPSTPRVPCSLESSVIEIFSRKLHSSNATHQQCHGLIGGSRGMTLSAWMDTFEWEKRKFRFVTAIANSRWIVKGEPSKSRFLKELAWKGRMFGAFTTKEKATVERWIKALEPQAEQSNKPNCYQGFIGTVPERTKPLQSMHYSDTLEPTRPEIIDFNTVVLTGTISRQKIAMLLLYSLIPLQQTLASPMKAATHHGMSALRILRVFNGFPSQVDDAVDGMDEVYFPSRRSISDIAVQLNLMDLPKPISCSFLQHEASWQWLEQVALDPESNLWFLFGVQYGFIINLTMNQQMLQASGIDEDVVNTLEDIGISVLYEMSRMQIENRWECQLGHSVLSSCLRI